MNHRIFSRVVFVASLFPCILACTEHGDGDETGQAARDEAPAPSPADRLDPPSKSTPLEPVEPEATSAPDDPTPLEPTPSKITVGPGLVDPAVIDVGQDERGRVRLLVRFAPGADRNRAFAHVAQSGGRIAYQYRLVPDLVAVRDLPVAAVEGLSHAPGVRALLPDHRRTKNLVESLPLMQSTPAQLSGYSDGSGASDGSGVLVCVLDTGINKGHPALTGAVVAEWDFANGDSLANDLNGHGTHVASTIASRHPTYPGVAPGAGLLIGKVLGDTGTGDDSDIMAAIDWCTLDVAAAVINMSLGGGFFQGACDDRDALAQSVNASVDAGVVNVIASGNENRANGTGSPGCASRALTIGAVYDANIGGAGWSGCTDTTTAPDKIVCFSNEGLTVDFVAPGAVITAADAFSSGFVGMSGTSMATPHVAGLVARLVDARPDLKPNDVARFLARNADDRGTAGYDVAYGNGRVDGLATLADPTAVACSDAGACADLDACTVDVCQGGACGYQRACGDGDAGTIDGCTAGSCSHTAVTLNDARSCTTDVLDSCTGPRYTPNNGACNPSCALAVPIAVGQTVTGSTTNATNTLNSSCPGFTNAGRNVVYRLQLSPQQPVRIALSTTTALWDPSLYLIAGTSATTCNVGQCVAGTDVGVNGGNELLARVRVPMAGYYYLVVDTYYTTANASTAIVGDYTLSVTAACDPEDAGRACDDGNECTFNDTCTGMVCAGGAPGCTTHAQCSDGDACNGAETCQGGSCQGGTAPTCNDGNACTSDSCVPASGCMYLPVTNGTSCADATVCNGAETCSGGSCTAGTPLGCDDGRPCTVDTCNAVSGCQNPNAANGTACADGDACNGDETCTAGACGPGVTLDCDDTNLCTSDSCDVTTGCVNAPLANGVACADATVCNGAETCLNGSCQLGVTLVCDDAKVCTTDSCDPSTGCQHAAIANGTSCADGDFCDGAETCQSGLCADGAPLACDDGNACNGVETCTVGGCQPGATLVCNDSNPCTVDSCNPALGCQYVAFANGTSCADATVCNGAETCQLGLCTAGAAPTCNDGNPCTANTCDPIAGCGYPMLPNDTSCADSTVCNGAETCQAGTCTLGTAPACDDSNPCTDNTCNATSGCAYPPVANDTPCADDTVCNGAETCQTGVCTNGTPPACDGGECGEATCDPVTGCVIAALPDGTACGDGDPCNGDELCGEGACQPSAAPPCDDGNACNGIEICTGTSCAPGTAPNCNDGNACTADGCHPVLGCVYEPDPAGTCSDGDVCNGVETCQGINCVAGVLLGCDDPNPCTVDSCDPIEGCKHVAVADGTPCSDGDLCNSPDSCQSGACTGGTPLDCDDDNACTSDTCDAASGCGNTPVANGTGCEDGDACTSGESCQTGACVGGANTCLVPYLMLGTVNAVSLGGNNLNDEDLSRYNLASPGYTVYFDGSDVGLPSGSAISALAIVPPNAGSIGPAGSLVLAFEASVTIPNLAGEPGNNNVVDPRDLVLFTPSALGSVTSGTFTFLFDGSDVGLTQSNESIDALAILVEPNDTFSLLVSTTGSASVTGVSAAAQDLMRFTPTALGSVTSGSWSMYFDGSDVGLSQSSENIDAVTVLGDGSLLLSTSGNASVTGLSAADEDVFRFAPGNFGASTSGTFQAWFDGSTAGLGDDVSALEWIELAP